MAAAGMVPADLKAAVDKQVEEGSPLGMTAAVWDQRLEWVADEWEVDIPRDVKGADSMVVFSSIEVMKFPTNIAAIAKILNKAGEKWTVSSQAREVVNFGFYEGSEEHTKLFLSRILEGAKELDVKLIRLPVSKAIYASKPNWTRIIPSRRRIPPAPWCVGSKLF